MKFRSIGKLTLKQKLNKSSYIDIDIFLIKVLNFIFELFIIE